MTESYREQHPLLCDEVSDEEQFSSQYQRRYRPAYRGRARTNAKGAAAIITQWPEHWTSSLTYWWAGLTMIAITIFAIYNCIIAFALLPSHAKATRPRNMNKFENGLNASSLPEVFMHIFINSNEEIELNKYLPYIEIISNKYTDFKYNLIVIHNNTVQNEFKTLTAGESNNLALNSLWNKQNILEKQKIVKHTINVEHTTLSDYMKESPLKMDWRNMPHQFIEFLVKAVSIWDKGGIALNPLVLTPRSPHTIYIEKIQNLLQKYKKCKDHKFDDIKTKKHLSKQKDKMKKRVNNIRDIIDILEHDTGSFNTSQYSLTEAENKNSPIIHTGYKLLSTALVNVDNTTYVESPNDIRIRSEVKKTIDKTNIQEVEHTQSLENNKTKKFSLLPLFLEFLFHDKSKVNVHKMKDEPLVDSVTRQRKSIIHLDDTKKNQNSASTVFLNNTKDNYGEEYKPMIIPVKNVNLDGNMEKVSNIIDIVDCNHVDNLTIDLKGNILATITPCHAFVGTIFSNLIHHTKEETLNDLIITELSIFCKGLLSTCKGIDVILL